jgi:autoinducer 2-degrading protein
MYVVCVTIKVKPEFIEPFKAATLLNHQGTRRDEPGNVRWDFLQAEDEPTRFFLYEVYKTKEDFTKHQQMPHYFQWREACAEMMAEPRVGLRYINISPADQDWNA